MPDTGSTPIVTLKTVYEKLELVQGQLNRWHNMSSMVETMQAQFGKMQNQLSVLWAFNGIYTVVIGAVLIDFFKEK